MATPVVAADMVSTAVESEEQSSSSIQGNATPLNPLPSAASHHPQVGVDSRSPRSYQGRHSYGDTISYAAVRIDAADPLISISNRVCILWSVLLLGWACNLDHTLRFWYQVQAIDVMAGHRRMFAMSVIRYFINSVIQPTAAKLSDVFGRLELLLVAMIFTIGGTVIMAAASEANTVVIGTAFYEVGSTTSTLILQVIIADVTPLQSRLFFTYFPAAPTIINVWISYPLYQLMRAKLTWHVGLWFWCIAYPLCAMPLVCSMWMLRYKMKRAGLHYDYKRPLQERGVLGLAESLFWELDVIGILLSLVGFSLFLVPICVEASHYAFARWQKELFVPMIIGALILPVWVTCERRAPHPMVPLYILKDRAIWGALGVAFFAMFAWECQGVYLYPVLLIAFDQSRTVSLRITNLYPFFSTVSGLIVGAIVYRTRRLKWFILTGALISLMSFYLMIYFQGVLGTQNGIVGSQILMGIAGGFFSNAALVSLQACVKHEHVAIVTALYLTMYNIGLACGLSTAGSLFNYLVAKKLYKELGDTGMRWVHNPLPDFGQHPIGDPERDTVNLIFKHFERVVCIAGAFVTIFLGIFAFCVRDPKLPDTQSLPYDVIHRPLEDEDYDQDQELSEVAGVIRH